MGVANIQSGMANPSTSFRLYGFKFLSVGVALSVPSQFSFFISPRATVHIFFGLI